MTDMQPTFEGKLRQHLTVILVHAQLVERQLAAYGNEVSRQMRAEMAVILAEVEKIVEMLEGEEVASGDGDNSRIATWTGEAWKALKAKLEGEENDARRC